MNTQSLIAVCRSGFYISMLVAFLGAAAAALIVVKCDIRTIWEIRTGRTRRQSIKEMEQSSRNQGWMRKEDTPAGGYSGDEAEKNEERVPTADLELQTVTDTVPLESPRKETRSDRAITTELSFEGTLDLDEREETALLTPAVRTHFVLTQQIVITHCDDVIA